MDFKKEFQMLMEQVESGFVEDKELNEIIKGCRKLEAKAKELVGGKRMSLSIKLWFTNNPTIKHMITSDVYDNYSAFCTKFAIKPESSNALGRAIGLEYGFTSKVVTISGKTKRIYV